MTDETVRLDGLVPAALQPRSAKILLDSLEVETDIGFHDFEIGTPQRLLVTVEVWIDELPPAGSDDPAHAWDYDHVRNLVRELAGKRRYNLQESFAGAIYQQVASMHGVKALRVATSKPDIYPDARGVGVEIASF
jgi:dihydroneopterin aldolase